MLKTLLYENHVQGNKPISFNEIRLVHSKDEHGGLVTVNARYKLDPQCENTEEMLGKLLCLDFRYKVGRLLLSVDIEDVNMDDEGLNYSTVINFANLGVISSLISKLKSTKFTCDELFIDGELVLEKVYFNHQPSSKRIRFKTNYSGSSEPLKPMDLAVAYYPKKTGLQMEIRDMLTQKFFEFTISISILKGGLNVKGKFNGREVDRLISCPLDVLTLIQSAV